MNNDLKDNVQKLEQFILQVNDYRADGASVDEALAAVLDDVESKEQLNAPLMSSHNIHSSTTPTPIYPLETDLETNPSQEQPKKNIFNLFHTKKPSPSYQKLTAPYLKTDKKTTGLGCCTIL